MEEKFFKPRPVDGSDEELNQLYEIELARANKLAEKKVTLPPPQRESLLAEDLGEGVLTLDVYRTPTEVVIESAIAGVNPKDIDIDITADSITIKGQRHHDKNLKEEDYDLQECYWGRFSRSIILPEEVDAEAAKADFKNGILTIRLPKKSKQRSKKLVVGE